MDSGIAITSACVIFVFLMFLANDFGVSNGIEKMQLEAVQKGYASFCPLDGKWAWNGECKTVAEK